MNQPPNNPTPSQPTQQTQQTLNDSNHFTTTLIASTLLASALSDPCGAREYPIVNHIDSKKMSAPSFADFAPLTGCLKALRNVSTPLTHSYNTNKHSLYGCGGGDGAGRVQMSLNIIDSQRDDFPHHNPTRPNPPPLQHDLHNTSHHCDLLRLTTSSFGALVELLKYHTDTTFNFDPETQQWSLRIPIPATATNSGGVNVIVLKPSGAQQVNNNPQAVNNNNNPLQVDTNHITDSQQPPPTPPHNFDDDLVRHLDFLKSMDIMSRDVTLHHFYIADLMAKAKFQWDHRPQPINTTTSFGLLSVFGSYHQLYSDVVIQPQILPQFHLCV